MLATSLFILALASSGSGADGAGVDRFTLLFLTPSGDLNHVRSAEVVSFVDRTIEARTDLDLDRLDATAVRECRGRLSCFVQRARPDYDRRVYFLPSGGVAPFEEHVDYVARRGLSVCRYLLLASGVGTPSGDALTFTLVDVDAALAWRHSRDELRRKDEIELLRTATMGRPLRVEVASSRDLDAILDRLVDELLAPGLSARGRWDPFGALLVRASVAGAGVYVDDRLRTTTRLEPVRIDRIPPGRATVRVEHPEFQPQSVEVEVTRSRTTEIAVELEPLPSATGRVLNQTTFWSGLGVAGAGVALIVAGAVDAASAPTTACTDCGSTFRRFSTELSSDPTAPPAESGPLTVPLGYSMALTGATWAVGSRLTDRDRVPWVAWLVGAAAGGLAYGISEAAR